MASMSLPAGYSKDFRVATQAGQAAPVVRTLSFSQQAAPAPQAASISRIPTRVQRATSFHAGAPTHPTTVYTAPGPVGRQTIHPAVPAATHGFVAPGFGRQTSTPVTHVTQPFGRQTSTPATVTQPFGRQTSTPATVTHAFGRQTSTPAPVPLQQAVPAPIYRRYTSFTAPPGVGLAAAARAATAFHTQPATQSQDQPSQDEFDVEELQPEVVAAADGQILTQTIAEDVEPTEDATVQ
ncbi:unnamed protein product, partial [Symbiodinium sp. CCMP2456]